MEESSWFAIAYLLTICFIGGVAQRTGTQFPTCEPDVTERCNSSCIEVKISLPHTAEYSSNNTLCIDSDSAPAKPPYRLEGCPNQYFDTYQGTGGVCVVATGSGTDILLTGDALPEGLYQFICFVNSSHSINASVIVANDDRPYRDVLVYNNGVLRNHYDSTNVTVDAHVGDNISVVARAIGNVSVLNATNENFQCKTGFACKHYSRNNVDNRYLQCSLNSSAEPIDVERVLTILVGDTELIIITIIWRSDSTNSSSNGGVSGGVIAGVVLGVVMAVALAAATLCGILCYTRKKLRVHNKVPQKEVSTPQQVILNSACPHCDILDPQIEGKKGYVMQKLSKEQLTNDHMTLLNEGALLIVCSCIEYAIPNQLSEDSSVSKDWLVVQLQQGDTGDSPLQSNGNFKNVTFNDLGNDRAVDEILQWFETESLKRTNTANSITKQPQSMSGSTEEVLVKQTKMLEQQNEKLELQNDKLEEIKTRVEALQKDMPIHQNDN